MPRNINRRVEVLFPVQERHMIRYLRDDVLATCLADNLRARRMLPDGTYERLKPPSKAKSVDSQAWLLNHHLHPQKG